MVRIVIVNGMPGCGKTTFENYCVRKLSPYADVYSTVDFVKEIAENCGWDGSKTLENRKFLSDLKKLLVEWNDIPFKKVKRRAESLNFELESFGLTERTAFLFVDSREPEEIQRFADELGAITVLVRRPEVEQDEVSNSSDANVFNCEYDCIVMNDGDLDKLYSAADIFLEHIDKFKCAVFNVNQKREREID